MKNSNTSQTTKKQIKYDITVAQDGSGDFKTIQEAINSIPANNNKRTVIFIKKGTYKELVRIYRGIISLVGESREETKITNNLPASQFSSEGCATVVVKSNDFTAENITFENSYGRGSQALAMYLVSDRAIFKNCAFYGCQDTLYTADVSSSLYARNYFENCYISGDVDFIYGSATAVFYKCEINSLDRGSNNNNGYIVAPNTPISKKYGFVFLECKLTSSAAKNSVYLGRPWRQDASTIYKNCEMGEHIRADGWTNMHENVAAKARFFEYKNTGPGAIISETRRQLSDAEGQEVTIDNVLKGSDNWNPQAPVY